MFLANVMNTRHNKRKPQSTLPVYHCSPDHPTLLITAQHHLPHLTINTIRTPYSSIRIPPQSYTHRNQHHPISLQIHQITKLPYRHPTQPNEHHLYATIYPPYPYSFSQASQLTKDPHPHPRHQAHNRWPRGGERIQEAEAKTRE